MNQIDFFQGQVDYNGASVAKIAQVQRQLDYKKPTEMVKTNDQEVATTTTLIIEFLDEKVEQNMIVQEMSQSTQLFHLA